MAHVGIVSIHKPMFGIAVHWVVCPAFVTGLFWGAVVLVGELLQGETTGPATVYIATANAQGTFLALLVLVNFVYVHAPSQLRQRRALAKKANENGTWDLYVDDWASVIRHPALEIVLVVVGLAMTGSFAWLVTSEARQDNTFFDADYYALAFGVCTLFAGLLLIVTRQLSFWTRDKPGQLSRRDLYGCLALVPMLASGLTHSVVVTVYLTGSGRNLTQTAGSGVVMMLWAIMWGAMFMHFVVGMYLHGKIRARSYVNEDHQAYKKFWAAILDRNRTALVDLAKTCSGLKSQDQPRQQLDRKKSNFENFAALFQRSKGQWLRSLHFCHAPMSPLLHASESQHEQASGGFMS